MKTAITYVRCDTYTKDEQKNDICRYLLYSCVRLTESMILFVFHVPTYFCHSYSSGIFEMKIKYYGYTDKIMHIGVSSDIYKL